MAGLSVISVSQLNQYVKAIFEAEELLQNLYIKGEISNFVHHYKSGHYYFTIKDQNAAVKAVMFKSYAGTLPFVPENGMSVIVRGKLSVYERDGVYQLYAYDMQPDGVGSLHIAFEQLKEKLAKRGLFDEQHKKNLPAYPERIGIITSATGAALQDMLNVLTRRYPVAKVLLCPALVQGEKAAASIIHALNRLNAEKRCDVVIIGRGGGSIEDLWAFNDESLARCIFDSVIPVVSAVGHETDFTICDFVADLRAPTPSAAAELVSPNLEDVRHHLSQLHLRMQQAVTRRTEACDLRLKSVKVQACIRSPLFFVEQHRQRLVQSKQMIKNHAKNRIENTEAQFMRLGAVIDSLSPLKVLTRGYSIARTSDHAVRGVNDAAVGDTLITSVQDGEIVSQIQAIIPVKTVQ